MTNLKEITKDDLDYIVMCVEESMPVWLNINRKPYLLNNNAKRKENSKAGFAIKNTFLNKDKYRAFINLNEKEEPSIIVMTEFINIVIR